jgi:hypothetical protein
MNDKQKKRTKSETREIVVKLTDAEIVDRAKGLSKVLTAIEDLEDEMKSKATSYKDSIKAKQVEARRLSGIVRTGEETQEKDVLIEFHSPQIGLKRTTRKDTGEELSVEKMSEYECQDILEFGDKAEAGENDAKDEKSAEDSDAPGEAPREAARRAS